MRLSFKHSSLSIFFVLSWCFFALSQQASSEVLPSGLTVFQLESCQKGSVPYAEVSNNNLSVSDKGDHFEANVNVSCTPVICYMKIFRSLFSKSTWSVSMRAYAKYRTSFSYDASGIQTFTIMNSPVKENLSKDEASQLVQSLLDEGRCMSKSVDYSVPEL